MGLVQTAWLFTRGSQSVRIIRLTRPNGPVQMMVQGPGNERSVHEADTLACVRFQLDLERQLVAEGFQLASFVSAERRSGRDRRGASRGPDRRVSLEVVN